MNIKNQTAALRNFWMPGKMKPACVVLLVLGSAVCAGCATMSQEPCEEMRAGIAASNREFIAAVRASDAAGLANLYTLDGELLPPASHIVTGRHAIQQHWRESLDGGMADLELRSVEVHGKGALAYEVGKYTVIGDGGEVTDKGKFLVIWKRVDGRWDLHRDIWNSDMPPAAP